MEPEIMSDSVWVKIDGDRNVMADYELDILEEKWREKIGDEEVGPTRLFRISISCPVPRATQINVDIKDTEDIISIKVSDSNKE